MGQKVNPIGIRLGITREWTSRWYANTRNFPAYLHQDWLVREFLKKKLAEASVSRIHIERAARKSNITIHTARPGVVIGKKGEDIERLRLEVAKMMGMAVQDVRLNIAEIRKPEVDAQLVAEGIAQQIERRVMFRRAMKRAVMRERSVAFSAKSPNATELPRCELPFRLPLNCLRNLVRFGCIMSVYPSAQPAAGSGATAGAGSAGFSASFAASAKAWASSASASVSRSNTSPLNTQTLTPMTP